MKNTTPVFDRNKSSRDWDHTRERQRGAKSDFAPTSNSTANPHPRDGENPQLYSSISSKP